jgi:hypothetical protein
MRCIFWASTPTVFAHGINVVSTRLWDRVWGCGGACARATGPVEASDSDSSSSVWDPLDDSSE